MSLLDEIKSMLSEQLRMPLERIRPESVLAEHLFMDYVDLVQLAIKLEVRYGIEIADEDLERIATVRELVDHVGEKARALP